MPRRERRLDVRTPAIVAHRGASAELRENTMEAFRAAYAQGADLSELDVWLSADGVPMVHHDEAVAGGQAIGSLTRTELRDDPRSAHIPTLDEVLDQARGRWGVEIELKGPGTAGPVAELVRRHGMAASVVIGSFEPALVAEVRAAAPELLTAILYSATHVDALIALGLDLSVDYLHPCWKRAAPRPDALLGPDVVRRMRSAGMGVITWDEDRPEVLRPLFAAGVDAVSTNLPSLAAAIRA